MAAILTHPAPARPLRRRSEASRDAPFLRRDRNQRRPEAYPLGYVGDLSDVRTKLEVIFSVRLMNVVGNIHQ
jgi:hypothetical protein